jgi:hypothetical protein
VGGAFKTITTAGIIGLVVLHADAFARLAGNVLGVFRQAVKLA